MIKNDGLLIDTKYFLCRPPNPGLKDNFAEEEKKKKESFNST